MEETKQQEQSEPVKSEESKDLAQSNNKPKKTKKRKKWPWILLAVVLALSIGITVLAVWQWNNIMALYYAGKYTPEQLQQMDQANKLQMQQICSKVSNVDITLLPEDIQKLMDEGKLSQQEAIAIMLGKIRWDGKTVVATVEDKTTSTEIAGEPVSRVDEIIGRIYLLRSNYVGKLDSLVAQAWSEYKKGGISKQNLISKYLGIGYGLEGECDGQLEGLLAELSGELSRTGGDLSVIEEIRHTYRSQKSIKKAEMIAKYQK